MVTFVNTESLAVIIAMAIPMLIFTYMAETGKGTFELRRLPTLDFVEDMVRAASEQAQPIMLATGTKIKLGETMYMMMFRVLRHICHVAARLNVRTIITSAQPTVASVIVDWAKEGYFEAGHPERFNLQDVYSFADGYHAEPLGNVGLIHSAHPAGVIYLAQTNWNFSIMPMGAANLAGITQAHLGPNADAHTFASVLASQTVTAQDTVAMGYYLQNEPSENAIQSSQDVALITITIALWILFIIQILGLQFW